MPPRPQGQGLQWLRVKEEHNGVKVSNFTDKHFPDHLRDQLRDGRPLLIENCTEEIDPMLDPVLEKVWASGHRSLPFVDAFAAWGGGTDRTVPAEVNHLGVFGSCEENHQKFWDIFQKVVFV